jgi:hypothetical protein
MQKAYVDIRYVKGAVVLVGVTIYMKKKMAA